MRKRSIIAGAAVALSLAVAGTAQADTVSTTFDGPEKINGVDGPDWAIGSVNGQYGWKVADKYDEGVVADGIGTGNAFRISNAVTDSSFGDMTFSKPVLKPAGENEATNRLVNEFTVKAPDTFVEGLVVSVSPDAGDGSRMSYLRLEDHADGVRVFFTDSTFVAQQIATLNRSVPHTIKFETTFVEGDDNDVVQILIDGDQKMRGGSWENYYRSTEQRNPSPSDRLLIRTAGTAAPATLDSGFLFDNVTSASSHVDNPAPLNPPAPGPQGPAGQNGTNGTDGTDGVNGKDGVTTVIVDRGELAGNTVRTLHARKIQGKTLVSLRASLRGKRLQAHGRSVKVDLRGKTVGTYNVVMVAKYKTKSTGKIHTVRTIRSLSVLRR